MIILPVDVWNPYVYVDATDDTRCAGTCILWNIDEVCSLHTKDALKCHCITLSWIVTESLYILQSPNHRHRNYFVATVLLTKGTVRSGVLQSICTDILVVRIRGVVTVCSL